MPEMSERIEATVVIFGGEHRLQLKCPQFSSRIDRDRERWQKAHFAAALFGMVLEYKVTFIGEEIGYGQQSLVEDVARACECCYSIIDMPMPSRLARRCFGGYDSVLGKEEFRSEEDWRANIQKCHRLREEFMYQRVLEFLGPAASALVVCGKCHAHPLKQKFERRVTRVLARTLSDPDCGWFDKGLYRWNDDT
jgi:hypothetical protein